MLRAVPIVKREVEQVWECPKGHRLESPVGVRYLGAVCGPCSRRFAGNPDVRAGARQWEMKLVQVRSVNGRLVAA